VLLSLVRGRVARC